MGELADAEADVHAALAAAGGERSPLAPRNLATLTQVLIERGQLREAAALLNQREIPIALDQPRTANWLQYAHGRLAAAMGQWRAAADSLVALGERAMASGVRNPGLLDWRTGAALALSQLGEVERARGLVDEVVELSRYLGQPRWLSLGGRRWVAAREHSRSPRWVMRPFLRARGIASRAGGRGCAGRRSARL